jgi:ribose/xylose/arabinose/galactoside ABC-type transport system permease subunit
VTGLARVQRDGLELWRARSGLAQLGAEREVVIFALVLLEFGAFAAFAKGFLSSSNLSDVLRDSTELGLIAAGMTLLIVQGAIDVSVGSILGVVAIVVAKLLEWGIPAPLVVLAAVALGGLLGAGNGALVTVARVPPIIATLGTMSIWRAGVFLLLGGEILTGIPSVSGSLERGGVAGVPLVFCGVVAVYGALWYVMRHRVFGRTIYAIGNNEEAARLAGLPIQRVKLSTFVILGGLVGLAAVTYTMRVPSVEPTVAQDYALLAIAAVVIGGASITGGTGSVVGTFMGVLFVAFLRNGLVLFGIPSLWEQAALGACIIISVGVDQVVNRRRSRARALAEL